MAMSLSSKIRRMSHRRCLPGEQPLAGVWVRFTLFLKLNQYFTYFPLLTYSRNRANSNSHLVHYWRLSPKRQFIHRGLISFIDGKLCSLPNDVFLLQKLCLAFKPTSDYGPIDDKTFSEWVQWKIEKNDPQTGAFTDISADNAYQQKKSSLFAVVSDKKGSDNLGFIVDEKGFSFGGQSSHDSKGSFRRPKLLSTRRFDDNY